MTAFNFLKTFLPTPFNTPRKQCSRGRRSFGLRLEPLEDRAVPAIFTWTGPVREFWSNPANWVENRVPESGPDADLDRNDEIRLNGSSFNDISSETTSVHAAKIVVGFSDDGTPHSGTISGGSVRLDSSTGPSEFT